MAAIKQLPLLILLAALLFGAFLAAGKEETPAASAPAPAPGPAVADVFDPDNECREISTYPKLCQKLISVYQPNSSEELVESSIKEAMKKARVARRSTEKLVKANEEDDSVADPLKKCSKGYDKVVAALEKSLSLFKDGDKKRSARRVIDAQNVVGFCYDSFDPAHDYNGLLDFPGKRTYTNIRKLLTNSYNLACGSKAGECTNY